jgi:hypothetical protein
MPNGAKYGGRTAGTPNKATGAAREAIAAFVDGNAHRLQEWLTAVAEGVVEPAGEDGKPGKVLVAPNPARAFELFQSVVEYHIPKLARTELTGKEGGDIVTRHVIELHEGPPPAKEGNGPDVPGGGAV